jgi:hypothetical protein
VVVDDDPRERDLLVTTLVETFDLLGVADEACRRAGIEGREQQVAYCLVALCCKADPVRASARTYDLDVGADAFAGRLATQADAIAANMARWASVYEQIQDEFDRHEIATLRSLIHVRRGDDDIIDTIADKLGTVIWLGHRLDDMTLELAREGDHAGAEYVFQSPLSRWVGTSTKRAVPWDTDPLDTHEPQQRASDGSTEFEDEIAQRDELDLDAFREFVDRVAQLAETRSLLPAAIEQAGRLERAAAGSRLARATDSTLLGRLRAELMHVADGLNREQRAFGGVLAYIVLAMRTAPKLQGVTILSLRLSSLDPLAVDHIARRVRAVIEDEREPTPRLVSMTAEAKVSRRRVKALEEVRDAPGLRAETLRPVVDLLDALPPVVADVAAIGDALPEPLSASGAATYRLNAANELQAVDPWFERAFRRYATIGRA